MLDINCFTTSYHRPYHLYNTINNILNQSYKDLTYSVNICIDNDSEEILYKKFLSDFTNDSRLKVCFAYNEYQHTNYCRAINYCNNYSNSIYIKIDDDDIYHKNYISDMVTAYKESNIDILSSVSNLVINNKYIKLEKMQNIGQWSGDIDKVQFGMPPTYVFNKKAKDIIINLSSNYLASTHFFEDAVWRSAWRDNGLSSKIIDNNNFVYHIHGKNISSSYMLDIDENNDLIYIDDNNFILAFFKHNSWSSYIFCNKRNNRLFNIKNNDHGKYILSDNQIKIIWDNWQTEVYEKKQNKKFIYFEVIQ